MLQMRKNSAQHIDQNKREGGGREASPLTNQQIQAFDIFKADNSILFSSSFFLRFDSIGLVDEPRKKAAANQDEKEVRKERRTKPKLAPLYPPLPLTSLSCLRLQDLSEHVLPGLFHLPLALLLFFRCLGSRSMTTESTSPADLLLLLLLREQLSHSLLANRLELRIVGLVLFVCGRQH